MKLAPDKIGGTTKQKIWLGGLVVVLILVWIFNRDSSPTPAPISSSGGTAAPGALTPFPGSNAGPRPSTTPQPPMPQQRRVQSNSRSGGAGGARVVEDFHPSIKPKEGVDITQFDPTIKLALLAKVKHVEIEGGARSLFDFGAAPAPPPPPVSPIKPGMQVGANVPKPDEVKGPVTQSKPPPTPIPFKFYGYAAPPRSGPRRAFFIDGEEIFIVGENEMIRNRYKIIRIGVNSAVVEDTKDKHQQTLPLEEEKNV
jgi:hypothetical protein